MTTGDEIQRILNKHGLKPPRCGFYAGDGWLPHIDRAFADMVAAGWDKELYQVKEKLGGLRIYIGKRTAQIDSIIERAESVCAKTCLDCGEPHGLKVPLLGIPVCEDCLKKDEYTSYREVLAEEEKP